VWIDLPETKVVNGVTQVSKKDEERFRDPDELLSQIHVDTYAGKSVKGLIVRNVDSKLAKTFGIAAGEVLIEINGRAVRSRSEALELGKGDYRRGVRTFVTKWLANGAVIERTYQAPDR
jgi:type II secretory pathway component PulC